MIYAIIDNGEVINTIVVDGECSCPGSVRIDELVPVPGIGWSYDGETFTMPARLQPGWDGE